MLAKMGEFQNYHVLCKEDGTRDDTGGSDGVYIGICKCGNTVAACVDSPSHREDTAEFLSDIVKDGLTAQRVARVEVNLAHCACPDRPQPESPEPRKPWCLGCGWEYEHSGYRKHNSCESCWRKITELLEAGFTPEQIATGADEFGRRVVVATTKHLAETIAELKG